MITEIIFVHYTLQLISITLQNGSKHHPDFINMTERVLFLLYEFHCFNPERDSLNELMHCFNLSFPSSPCHGYLSTSATVPHSTASSGVKNIRLCPFAPLEFVWVQVTGHKSIFCIRETQEWANGVSSHLLCLSYSWQGPRRETSRCLLTVASSSSQSQGPVPSSTSLSSLTWKDKGHLGFLSSWNQVSSPSTTIHCKFPCFFMVIIWNNIVWRRRFVVQWGKDFDVGQARNWYWGHSFLHQ